MTLNEKRDLVELLQKYQNEQIILNERNRRTLQNNMGNKWDCDLSFGNKAQYNHARIISTKLSKEIGEELPSYWNL